MTSGVEVIAPEASISEAAAKMRHLDLGPLPVYEGARLVGMLTERDSTVRAVTVGRDPLTTQGREVMTPDVVSGFDAHEVQDAVHLMAQYQRRRLLVLNRRQQLVGMVALGDLAVHAGTQPVTAEGRAQVSELGKAGCKERPTLDNDAWGWAPSRLGRANACRQAAPPQAQEAL